MASLYAGSAIADDNPCGSCLKDDKDIDSVKYCFECKLFLCGACVRQHQRFPDLKSHTLLDKAIVPMQNVIKVDLSGCGKIGIIKGVCVVVAGNERFTVLTDWDNKRMIVLDGSFSVVNKNDRRSKPHGICVLSDQRIAVTFRNSTYINVYSLDTHGAIAKDSEHLIARSCRGIASVADTLTDSMVVVNGGAFTDDPEDGHVNVLGVAKISTQFCQNNGRTIAPVMRVPASLGQQGLSPRSVAICETNGAIYFTDATVGVIRLCKSDAMTCEAVLMTSASSMLRGARGICMADGDELFVSGEDSHNVVKIKSDGTVLAEIVNSSHGIKSPVSLCYDKARQYLLVGCDNETAPFVYVKL